MILYERFIQFGNLCYKLILTGAVKTMLLLPGDSVTSLALSICAPSSRASAVSAVLGVSSEVALSSRRISRCMFLQARPAELSVLSDGLCSSISQSSSADADAGLAAGKVTVPSWF